MTRQYPLPLPHHIAMEADDLMVTASNRDAAAWIDQWPAWPSPCLIIHGPAGAGKTHVASIWRRRANARLLNIAEFLSCDPASVLEEQQHVAIDGVDGLAGNQEGEESLLHLYNMAREARGSLLLTALLPAAQWGILLPDLRSRLLAAPTAALAAPDDALVLALMIKQFRDRQLQVDAGVLDYLLPRLTRSPGEIRQLVSALDRESLAENKRISIALARRTLLGIQAS